MRTTVDIDERALNAVRSLAAQSGKTMGRVISELLTRALQPEEQLPERNGVPVFPRVEGEGPTTMELVNRLRDDE